MLLQAESKNGIVSEKIIIVEVQRPDVPCLDLVDLPGLVQSPEEKALETQKIYERQIFEKNQSLYLAVVPASARPNANAAVSFIQKHGLTERTCGVFSKCDEHMDADELRAKTLNEDTAEGEPAAEMGSVDFQYGWVASMLKRLETNRLRECSLRPPRPPTGRSDYWKHRHFERTFLQQKQARLKKDI